MLKENQLQLNEDKIKFIKILKNISKNIDKLERFLIFRKNVK